MTLPGLDAAAPGLWLHRDVAAWIDGIPQGIAASGVSAGRGAVERARCGAVTVIVRRYRRGGALRKLLPDAFLTARRAFDEARALGKLAPLGLSPRCLALQVEGSWLKRLTVAVEEVPGALDLLAHARDGERDDVGMARAAGRAVRAMHEAGVRHPDLNVTNVLARRDAQGWRAWVIDLDGARTSDGPAPESARVAEILRLCRSVDKWSESAASSATARGAFLRAALPVSLRRSALRAARHAHARRARMGRAPR